MVAAVEARSVALTVAGSDSGGGAGVQADLKTFEAFGLWGTSALTALTAQNTCGVRASYVLPPALVADQIQAVADDFEVRATKTGMLGDASVVKAVAGAVVRNRLGALVVDPVMVTSHGEPLLAPDAVAVMREELFPLASLVTPNIPEAELLLGHAIGGEAGLAEAAEELASAGAGAVLVKGGHLHSKRSPDVLWTGREAIWLEHPRIAATNTHGTGCTLSAAICAELALGADLPSACERAKAFVAGAIAHGAPLGHGIGPVDPAWRLRQPTGPPLL